MVEKEERKRRNRRQKRIFDGSVRARVEFLYK